MAVDVGALLAPASDGASGENLDNDPSFGDLERALAGKPERQIGKVVTPAEPPDWADVEKRSTELLGRTKDLRVGTALCIALAARRGFAGFADGLAVVRGLLERYWATVHPGLDTDDPTDATMRVNALASLCELSLLSTLRSAPLVQSRALGPITLRNLERGAGTAAPLDQASVEAAFNEASQEEIVSIATRLREALAHLAAIERTFTNVARGPDLSPVSHLVAAALRGVEPRIHIESVPAAASAPVQHEGAERAGTPVAAARPRELRSRDDVIRAIDAICDYYSAYEPSSPLPLLLRRCKRLVTMNFVQIIEEMAPAGLEQIKVIAGNSKE